MQKSYCMYGDVDDSAHSLISMAVIIILLKSYLFFLLNSLVANYNVSTSKKKEPRVDLKQNTIQSSNINVCVIYIILYYTIYIVL
jgi:hypothetical protein